MSFYHKPCNMSNWEASILKFGLLKLALLAHLQTDSWLLACSWSWSCRTGLSAPREIRAGINLRSSNLPKLGSWEIMRSWSARTGAVSFTRLWFWYNGWWGENFSNSDYILYHKIFSLVSGCGIISDTTDGEGNTLLTQNQVSSLSSRWEIQNKWSNLGRQPPGRRAGEAQKISFLFY